MGARTRANHSSTSALRAALFTALGLNLHLVLSGCGADSADAPAGDSTDAPAGDTPDTPTGDATDTPTDGATDTPSSNPLVCENPLSATRVASQSYDVGYEACGGGWIHRSRVAECPSALPRSEPIAGLDGETCDDASCAGPHGYCINVGGVGPSTFCAQGCVRDDECGAGQICFCDNPVGRCVPAACTSDADCPGSLCVGTPNRAPCGGPPTMVFACAQAGDECLAGSDCEVMECQVRNPTADGTTSPRQCGYGAVCGRPFLVEGTARQASVERRSDWASVPSAPDLQPLDASTRAVLAAHWTQLGLMEHASVAAFARFVLELMAAGAPSELLASAQQALGDEIEHARLCFGLASAYAATPLGPGALSAHGVLDDSSFEGCVVRAIHEACVGETLAAVEAQEAAATASDPAVLAVLHRVVRDESAHAELGWRFLQWALSQGTPALRQRAHAELERAIDLALAASASEADASAASSDASCEAAPRASESPELEQHGLCPAARRNAARRQALEHIVLPIGRALFPDAAGVSRAADAPSSPVAAA